MQIDTLIFDEDQILAFLHSVAHAKVAERNIKVVWKEYDESTVINVIYSIMPWKGKPGLAEVDPGELNKIHLETELEFDKLLRQFLTASARGAKRVVEWLTAQEKIRSLCLATVSSTYQDVAKINEEAADEARRGVARLATIKAASTIALKTTSLFVGGWPSFLIGFGYDVTLNLIKDWDKAPDAKLVGMASKTVDKFGKKFVKDMAKNAAYGYKSDASQAARKAEWLRKHLEEMEESLKKQARGKMLKKFARDTRRLERAEAEAARASRAATALSAVKYIFFAYDVYKAGQEATSDYQAAGYESSWEAIKDMVH